MNPCRVYELWGSLLSLLLLAPILQALRLNLVHVRDRTCLNLLGNQGVMYVDYFEWPTEGFSGPRTVGHTRDVLSRIVLDSLLFMYF